MILQFVIIFGCLAVGEIIVLYTGVKLPSSIIGMLLLTLLLKIKLIKPIQIKQLSDFLVQNLALFFVPPGVAIMLHFDLIQASFWPIVVAALGSTVIVLVVTGLVYQWVRKITRKKGLETLPNN